MEKYILFQLDNHWLTLAISLIVISGYFLLDKFLVRIGKDDID